MENGEKWMDLPDWDNSYSMQNTHSTNAFMNASGLEQIKNDSYNLSIRGDEEIAQNPTLSQAKTAKAQFDGHNCGAMCLFAAALRSGLKILLRDELLD